MRSIPTHDRRVVTATTTTLPTHERLLPREAMWFFVTAPPVLGFLFDPKCTLEPVHVARTIVAITLYTVVTGVVVHFSFEWLAARMRGTSLVLRLPVHALSTALVVALVTLPQLPIVIAIQPDASDEQITILWRGVIVSYVYLAIASFIGHLSRQAVRERLHAHEQRTAALEARLAALSAQMQPHFLFNSLNVVASLVHEEPDLAEETLERLASLLRYALTSTDKNLVCLADEMSAVRDYLAIQELRFGDKLRHRFDVSSEAAELAVPPMSIQPLVENAVLHGLRGREGEIVVTAVVEDGALALRVEDDGVGPGKSKHHGTGTALRNVQQRLELVFGPRARIATGASESGGFAVALHLPAVGVR